MRLAYCTNIWSHHQGPVCREFAKLLGDGFRMFVFQPLDCVWSKERQAMGWNLIPPNEPWIVGPPKTTKELSDNFFQGWIESADVLVYGENHYFDHEALLRRLKHGRLSFKMGERLLKSQMRWYWWFSPFFIRRWFITHNSFNYQSLHYLSMSHWCARDLHFFHACKGRIWRWGYLTEVSKTPTEKTERGKVNVGWCGRMLDWKNVDYILRAIALLPQSIRAHVELTLVGEGPEEEKLKQLAEISGLLDCVWFRPFLPQKEAMSFMSSLDVFVFPSGRKEGWGAILPEAMDKSCAVIANEAAGSTLELVRDGVNGFTFKNGDIKTLACRLSQLIVDGQLRKKMGQRAWRTMQEWSPSVGAYRFVALANTLLSGEHQHCPNCLRGLCELEG